MELQIINLKKCYRKKIALNDVSFSLTPGIYGLLGPNGSGKSTLMNILTSNIRATSGNVLWDGEDIQKLGKKYRAVLGYVPQQQALYPDFTVHTFLEYVAALRAIPKKQVAQQISFVLEQVELEDVSDYKTKMLSGGMKQRLLIAQAILGSPKLLVMDEPTVGLDPKQRLQIRSLIQKIAADKIVLIATHIVSDLELISNEVLLLREGILIERGTADELIQKTSQANGESNIHTLEDVYLYYFGEQHEKTNSI